MEMTAAQRPHSGLNKKCTNTKKGMIPETVIAIAKYLGMGLAMHLAWWLANVVMSWRDGIQEARSFFSGLGDYAPPVQGLAVLIALAVWPATLVGLILRTIKNVMALWDR